MIISFQAEDGMPNYIARIVELFETIGKQPYFRAEDTVDLTVVRYIGLVLFGGVC